MIRRIARSRGTAMIALLIILALPGEPLFAALQQQQSSFAKKLKDAQSKYDSTDVDSAIKILDEAINDPSFSRVESNLKVQAYELLAQCWLVKSSHEKLKSAIISLLKIDQAYSPPTDDPVFAEEVEKVKREMQAAEPAKPVMKEKESSWYESPWVWVGGGLLLAGGAYLLLKSPPDETNPIVPPSLPPPPNLPN
jgi:hypothetical protein